MILCFTLPPCAPALVDFFREFTIHVDGLGYVCSFAVFDFQRHGDTRFGAPVQGVEELVSEQGKLEKSVLGFKAANPGWQVGAVFSLGIDDGNMKKSLMRRRPMRYSPLTRPHRCICRGCRKLPPQQGRYILGPELVLESCRVAEGDQAAGTLCAAACRIRICVQGRVWVRVRDRFICTLTVMMSDINMLLLDGVRIARATVLFTTSTSISITLTICRKKMRYRKKTASSRISEARKRSTHEWGVVLRLRVLGGPGFDVGWLSAVSKTIVRYIGLCIHCIVVCQSFVVVRVYPLRLS